MAANHPRTQPISFLAKIVIPRTKKTCCGVRCDHNDCSKGEAGLSDGLAQKRDLLTVDPSVSQRKPQLASPMFIGLTNPSDGTEMPQPSLSSTPSELSESTPPLPQTPEPSTSSPSNPINKPRIGTNGNVLTRALPCDYCRHLRKKCDLRLPSKKELTELIEKKPLCIAALIDHTPTVPVIAARPRMTPKAWRPRPCEGCRDQRKKCDLSWPTCNYCKNRGVPCVYVDQPKQDIPAHKARVEILPNRVSDSAERIVAMSPPTLPAFGSIIRAPAPIPTRPASHNRFKSIERVRETSYAHYPSYSHGLHPAPTISHDQNRIVPSSSISAPHALASYSFAEQNHSALPDTPPTDRQFNKRVSAAYSFTSPSQIDLRVNNDSFTSQYSAFQYGPSESELVKDRQPRFYGQ
ncbi:hypothetical protein BCR33DRAFT_711774 [Rhizoclosmatium globosum]|uniref:Zn(2)-C6 fungal-type domain-containing protein n=1 Tax=Rhizoclosmatium globosum TaxID=329046 RepID=A0A1Y2CZH5_9FUNG|nr:hypothetical protein BCR33DRAFT_711774 [Rhizoclosmatium globosum]|eukprot:ORY52462.1 hypothetical protein BCR33DRAFT_711774 [Rhizoclosmatium globosum]